MLQKGFMHKRQLAEFFHKSGNTFMNHKDIFDRYCKILEDYAVFKVVRGGVEILEILDDEPYDEIILDFDRGIKEAIEKAPRSRYVENGKVFTATGILQYIIDTQATPDQKMAFEEDPHLFEKFQRRVSYRVRKMGLLDKGVLNKYWGCIEHGEQTQLEKGRVLIPLLKNPYEHFLDSYQELTKEDKELFEKLIAEEEENDEEHTKIAAYHLLDSAEYYKGNEKEFYAEAKRVCRPFYRAMKKFNKMRGKVYISKGTLYMEERD